MRREKVINFRKRCYFFLVVDGRWGVEFIKVGIVRYVIGVLNKYFMGCLN